MAKVVFITGGSSGIGKSIGNYLQDNGYVVYGTSRNPEKYPSSKFALLPLDVAKKSTIIKAIQTVFENEKRLDVLINNAGVGITGPVEEIPDAEIEANFDTNFFGPIRVIKAVLPIMRKQNSGQIINITSIAGYMGLPYRGIYSASKGALEIVTEAMRMEVKNFNIEISNLAPGDFATNIAAGRYHAPAVKTSPYYLAYSNTLNLMNNHVNAGKNPLLVAKVVYKIINTRKPKVHYKVGEFMQKVSIALKRILPDKVFEKLLLNHYKL